MPGHLGNKSWMRRLSEAVPGLTPSALQEWASVVLGFLCLGVATWSIEQAKWIEPQPSLTLVLSLAVLASLLLTKSRISNWATHLLMIVLGLAVMVWQSAGLFASTQVRSALHSWWYTVSGFQINEGTVYFAMFLIFVTWVIGFVSTWFILCRRNVWVAVALGTVTILVNISNLPRDYYYFFPIYLVVAVLLIGQGNLAKQDDAFRKQGFSYAYQGISYLLAAVLCISVLTVSAAWVIPAAAVDQAGIVTSGGMLREMSAREHWFNIFADVRSKWSLIESSDQETLLFRDPVDSSRTVRFVITSDRSGYWRTRRYDTYHSWGWTSSVTFDHELNPGMTAQRTETPSETELLTYTVESKLKTDIVLTGGELVSADIPVLLQTLSASESVASSPTSSTDQSTATKAGRIGGEAADVVAVVSPQLLAPYKRYTVVARLTAATPDELSRAGEDYPPWVTHHYLQLPDSLPERVRQEGQKVALGIETPYDTVVAVKRFLDEYKYDRTTETSHGGADAVDSFLFNEREGNCVDFASSMVVMLRSVGVPARLCTGYLRGELDRDTGNLIILGLHYHAWAEVYFPGYGWMEFEPTPSSPSGEAIATAGNSFRDIEELPHVTPTGRYSTYGNIPPPSMTPGDQAGPKVYTYFVIIGIPLLLILAARLAFERWAGRFKGARNASEAYAKMCLLASSLGSGPVAQETPLEYAARLALIVPEQAEAIGNIAQAYTETQFSRKKELGEVEKTRLQKSWVQLRSVLLQRLVRFRWWSK